MLKSRWYWRIDSWCSRAWLRRRTCGPWEEHRLQLWRRRGIWRPVCRMPLPFCQGTHKRCDRLGGFRRRARKSLEEREFKHFLIFSCKIRCQSSGVETDTWSCKLHLIGGSLFLIILTTYFLFVDQKKSSTWLMRAFINEKGYAKEKGKLIRICRS